MNVLSHYWKEMSSIEIINDLWFGKDISNKATLLDKITLDLIFCSANDIDNFIAERNSNNTGISLGDLHMFKRFKICTVTIKESLTNLLMHIKENSIIIDQFNFCGSKQDELQDLLDPSYFKNGLQILQYEF